MGGEPVSVAGHSGHTVLVSITSPECSKVLLGSASRVHLRPARGYSFHRSLAPAPEVQAEQQLPLLPSSQRDSLA